MEVSNCISILDGVATADLLQFCVQPLLITAVYTDDHLGYYKH